MLQIGVAHIPRHSQGEWGYRTGRLLSDTLDRLRSVVQKNPNPVEWRVKPWKEVSVENAHVVKHPICGSNNETLIWPPCENPILGAKLFLSFA